MDDKSVSTVSFAALNLPTIEDCVNSSPSSHKLHLLPASSEISASVLEGADPLESSLEMGVDIALSNSQNTAVGSELMSQHLEGGKARPKEFQWSERSSAFFKPIGAGLAGDETSHGQTDEEKSHQLIKPRPSIFVNDSEMSLSPLSPPYGKVGLSPNAFSPGR